ncbi:endolytic transglycosylase MltG [Halalkalibacillus halophilus]|uniref:endolytic transglycosylase MltG n=1 Tax=Halalkalibacillus halophilus TaxID=392827 RepID=UPI000403B519|nr:endolytic transglycosylase MltG [Halalkalibacillus halophilus]
MPSSKEEKYSWKRRRIKEASLARKIILIVLLVLIITIGIGAYLVYNYIEEGLSPKDPDNDTLIEVEIPLGSNAEDIGEILEENEVINNATLFRYYVSFNNESGFQAGEHQFAQSMEFDEIIESLKTGRIMVEPDFTVTIPEGVGVEQIASIMGEQTSIDGEEFMEQMQDLEYIESLIELYPNLLSEEILEEDVRYPLEGYLYAITYSFYEDEQSVNQIIEMMLQETERQIEPYREVINEHDFTIHEAITMASLIEMEAVGEEDRYTISGVFENRLNGDSEMRLQTDPTVIYAMDEDRERLFNEDYEYEHPYSTYTNDGLPPGPIANFRDNALDAALNPEEHNYLYFVASYEGEVFYAEEYEEHLANIEEHRPNREDPEEVE